MKIGISGPFSGKRKAYGDLIISNTNVVIKETKTNISFIYGDDSAVPTEALNVADFFIKEEVNAVIGHFNSSCALAVRPLYLKNNIIFIAPASTTVQLNGLAEARFQRTCPDNKDQVNLVLNFVKQTGKNRIRIINDGTHYGNELTSLTQKFAQQDNIPVEIIKSSHTIEESDLVWFTGTHHFCLDEALKINKPALNTPYVFCDDCYIDEFIHLYDHKFPLSFIVGLTNGGYQNIFSHSLKVLINHLEHGNDLIFQKEEWQLFNFKDIRNV